MRRNAKFEDPVFTADPSPMRDTFEVCAPAALTLPGLHRGFSQKLHPGELPIDPRTPRDSSLTARNFENLRHNFRLRQQRNGGHGYLTDEEAGYLLRRV